MARQKGKSRSTKPLSTKPPSWVTHGAKETIILVKKLAKQGYTSAKIGLILRDSYGIPDVKAITGKKIYQIIKEERKNKLPEELINIIKKVIQLKKHLDKNKKDKHSKKSLETATARIMKLTKYYKRKGELDKDWKYKPEEAEKLV